MTDTKIIAPWTGQIVDEQTEPVTSEPIIPVLDCMIPIYDYMEVSTLDEVFDNFREGMILCKSRTRGYFLVVPVE